MTKSIDALIQDACDVEEAANKYGIDVSWSIDSPEAFKAGAREAAERLVPALREAVSGLVRVKNISAHGPISHKIRGEKCKEALEIVRSILQKASEK